MSCLFDALVKQRRVIIDEFPRITEVTDDFEVTHHFGCDVHRSNHLSEVQFGVTQKLLHLKRSFDLMELVHVLQRLNQGRDFAARCDAVLIVQVTYKRQRSGGRRETSVSHNIAAPHTHKSTRTDLFGELLEPRLQTVVLLHSSQRLLTGKVLRQF